MPRSYLIFKWAVYALATLLLALVQLFVLDRVRLWGIVPFLPPMAVGVTASYEGVRPSGIYALVFGALCDLALPAAGMPAGFFTLVFTLSALLSASLAVHLFSPGLWCSLMATAVSYLVTALGRCAVLLPRGAAPLPVLATAAAECLATLPCLVLVFPLLRLVHRRTTVDY